HPWLQRRSRFSEPIPRRQVSNNIRKVIAIQYIEHINVQRQIAKSFSRPGFLAKECGDGEEFRKTQIQLCKSWSLTRITCDSRRAIVDDLIAVIIRVGGDI